ncbi:MAG: hypothetical protein EAZ09_04675 [Oscillatoriales cyanobacterium]|nr:MAG: hypothetical protein EAZ18_03000 [Oscillatoriales cyanobacterium]TAH24145.1 MAG: hypothetical protein EAZ09_04675 [Oscillatoriales cyanobacterium]
MRRIKISCDRFFKLNFLVICYLLLVIGYWLLVIGYWLLVIGYLLFVINWFLGSAWEPRSRGSASKSGGKKEAEPPDIRPQAEPRDEK